MDRKDWGVITIAVIAILALLFCGIIMNLSFQEGLNAPHTIDLRPIVKIDCNQINKRDIDINALIKINTNLMELNDRMEHMGEGINNFEIDYTRRLDDIGTNITMLYAYTNIRKNGKPTETIGGSYAFYIPDQYIAQSAWPSITRKEMCETFLHELGHDFYWDYNKDQSEVLANAYKENNLWRCKDLK